ncbi:hypothetical protein SDC9_164808 [bioreactor metagenome]|uniref:Uncharacterized protein n=1 Tax=bioreactor metagenome TaxID=1076179 RepID=A0A645FSM3_9ZZZZ
MLQQFFDGNQVTMGELQFRFIRSIGDVRSGNVLRDFIVDVEPAILHHFYNGGCGEIFGVACNSEPVIFAYLFAAFPH